MSQRLEHDPEADEHNNLHKSNGPTMLPTSMSLAALPAGTVMRPKRNAGVVTHLPVASVFSHRERSRSTALRSSRVSS
jgi:hypothetical protein